MSLDLVEDLLLELALLGQRGVQVGLQLSHLVSGGLLDLDFLSFEGSFGLLKLLVEGGHLDLVILGKLAKLLSLLALQAGKLCLKGLNLGGHFLIGGLELLFEAIKAITHAVLFEVSVEVIGELVQAANPCRQALWSHLELTLQSLLRREKLFFLGE